MDTFLTFLNTIINISVWQLPWWGYVLLALGLTHITIVCVTVFLHRMQAHRSVILAPAAAHFMRAWLWLTTGMVTKEWVAIHRKHHHKVESPQDPHSPRHWGLLTVLLRGTELYRQASTDIETMRVYGQGTPNDWAEKKIYGRSVIGIVGLFFIHFLLFGIPGIAIWAVQMMWIPIFAAGVINGAGHAVGYRNFDTPDDSTNLGNIGLLIGGEELHNNHHAYPGSAKLSVKPWEFDIGWMYIRLLEMCGLADVKRIAPVPQRTHITPVLDVDRVKILLHSRLHVMSEYINIVMRPVFRAELEKAKKVGQQQFLRCVKKPFFDNETRVCSSDRKKLKDVLVINHPMKTVYDFKHRLQNLWSEHRNDHEKLKEALHEWCHQAEASGLEVLQQFAIRIQSYSLRDPLPM